MVKKEQKPIASGGGGGRRSNSVLLPVVAKGAAACYFWWQWKEQQPATSGGNGRSSILVTVACMCEKCFGHKRSTKSFASSVWSSLQAYSGHKQDSRYSLNTTEDVYIIVHEYLCGIVQTCASTGV